MDDRVKLLIERIEQFPEEFSRNGDKCLEMKWGIWFDRHYDALTGVEKMTVDLALAKADRENAMRAILHTITVKNPR